MNEQDKVMFKAVGVILAVVFAVVMLICSISVVGVGEVGVASFMGKVSDNSLQSGFHMLNPFASVEKMDIKTQNYTMSAVATEGNKTGNDATNVLSKEGLSLGLDSTVYYHLDPSVAPEMVRTNGVEYTEKLVRPIIREAIRNVASGYSAQEIYADKREEVQKKMGDGIESGLSVRGIIFESILIRDIFLPGQLKKSIEDKLSAEQDAQKMDYTVLAAKKEAERKVAEANGIRDAQDIIAQKLSPEYLQWYNIDMMGKLAGSQNTTFLFVPTGQNGMPIVNISPTK